MKKFILVIAMALVLGTAVAPNANAKEGVFSLGTDLGFVFPSDGLSTRIAYGLDVRYGIMADWDLAFNALFSSKNGLGLSDFHLAGLYLYEGWSFGVKLGFTRVEQNTATVVVLGQTVTVGGASSTEFSFGPAVAYMFDTGVDNLTIGPELDFIITSGDNSVTKINALAKVMYTFN